jgi:hypothetical protein
LNPSTLRDKDTNIYGKHLVVVKKPNNNKILLKTIFTIKDSCFEVYF